MANPNRDVTIDVHHVGDDPSENLAMIADGLRGNPPWIASRFFYDDTGSRLFEAICETPEYYQTRTERALLASIADELVRKTGAEDLVELGSGAATKTRVLLDAMAAAGQLSRFVPFDINEMIVRRTADELAARYDGMQVHGVVGKFGQHLHAIPPGHRRLIIFLGGTIGNFEFSEAVAFMQDVAEGMGPEDYLLLGTDLIKDVDVLEAAYNDAQGMTAKFNRNILNAVNGIVRSDFDTANFKHVAFYNREYDRIEMWLEATTENTVTVPAADHVLSFKSGDRILTEISVKYDRKRAADLLARAGMDLVSFYTDPQEYFGLSLARLRTHA